MSRTRFLSFFKPKLLHPSGSFKTEPDLFSSLLLLPPVGFPVIYTAGSTRKTSQLPTSATNSGSWSWNSMADVTSQT